MNIKFAKKASITAAALGFGLAWIINKAVISRLERKDLAYDLESITTKDPLRVMQFQELGEKYAKKLKVAKRIQALNPLSIIPYARRLYSRYSQYYREARKY